MESAKNVLRPFSRVMLKLISTGNQLSPDMINPDHFADWGPNISKIDAPLKLLRRAGFSVRHRRSRVVDGLEEPLTVAAGPARRSLTERTGQIISPQKLSDSGLNLAGKESLTHAFDVHADRVVGCVNCHYSLNNPVYFEQRPESRPPHLDFDPRRLTSSDYLTRPLHQIRAIPRTGAKRGCAVEGKPYYYVVRLPQIRIGVGKAAPLEHEMVLKGF